MRARSNGGTPAVCQNKFLAYAPPVSVTFLTEASLRFAAIWKIHTSFGPPARVASLDMDTPVLQLYRPGANVRAPISPAPKLRNSLQRIQMICIHLCDISVLVTPVHQELRCVSFSAWLSFSAARPLCTGQQGFRWPNSLLIHAPKGRFFESEVKSLSKNLKPVSTRGESLTASHDRIMCDSNGFRLEPKHHDSHSY